MLAGVAALVNASPSQAAFGDAAGIFKREPTNATGLIPYTGKGFSVQLPSRWAPSKEQDVPNVVLRYVHLLCPNHRQGAGYPASGNCPQLQAILWEHKATLHNSIQSCCKKLEIQLHTWKPCDTQV